MEKTDFSTIGLNQVQPNKISMIKHRRHFPNEDTKSRIFGGDLCSTQSTTDSSKNPTAVNDADQENQQPPAGTSSNVNGQAGIDGLSFPRFTRGGNRRNAHTPF